MRASCFPASGRQNESPGTGRSEKSSERGRRATMTLPIRMDTSVRNPVPARQLGDAYIDLAYTFHIRIQTRIQVGEQVLAMPIHPLCTGGTRLEGSLAHCDDQSRAGGEGD